MRKGRGAACSLWRKGRCGQHGGLVQTKWKAFQKLDDPRGRRSGLRQWSLAEGCCRRFGADGRVALEQGVRFLTEFAVVGSNLDDRERGRGGVVWEVFQGDLMTGLVMPLLGERGDGPGAPRPRTIDSTGGVL